MIIFITNLSVRTLKLRLNPSTLQKVYLILQFICVDRDIDHELKSIDGSYQTVIDDTNKALHKLGSTTLSYRNIVSNEKIDKLKRKINSK